MVPPVLPIVSRPPIWPPGDQPPAGGPAQSAVWSVTIGYLVPVVPSTKETLVEPPWSCSTEIWPYCESWSSSRSRRSIRSFGLSPLVRNDLIDVFRPASSAAIFETSPPTPAIWLYWPVAASCAATICERTEWIESVSAPACWTSACLAAWSSGDFARSDQDCQNFDSWALMPVSDGSLSESSAESRPSARDFQSLRLVFCARYWASRKLSRTRRKPCTSTPEPRCAPVMLPAPETWICCASDADSSASWRE